MRAGVAPFGPVKIDIALAFFFKHKAMLGAPQLKLGADVAFGHGMRLLVQKAAMHRVHDIFQGIAVIALPFVVAKKMRMICAGQFIGYVQWRGLVQVGHAVVQPDRPMGFFDVKSARCARALQGATGAGRDLGHHAIAAHLDAVIRTSQTVAQHHPH